MKPLKSRWQRSIHCQTEALFHGIRGIGCKKTENPNSVRSFGSWKPYLAEAHRFAEYLRIQGCQSLLDTESVVLHIESYLREKLTLAVEKNGSLRSFRKLVSALGKLQFAINNWMNLHDSEVAPLNCDHIRKKFLQEGKRLLQKAKWSGALRAYPAPYMLVNAITNPTHQLQALLMLEGGLRAEGVGAASNGLKNPLTPASLVGKMPDPVTGDIVGAVASKEKGGKITTHFLPLDTYNRLEAYLDVHGTLGSEYAQLRASVEKAAHLTGQFLQGRANHGLKHCFARARYAQFVRHGMTHEQAICQVSRELSHFRANITYTYTRGK